jgi:hypothetical protein
VGAGNSLRHTFGRLLLARFGIAKRVGEQGVAYFGIDGDMMLNGHAGRLERTEEASLVLRRAIDVVIARVELHGAIAGRALHQAALDAHIDAWDEARPGECGAQLSQRRGFKQELLGSRLLE